MSTTLVTALFDIGRGQLSGKYTHRPFDKYLEWFKNTLSINAPMVIYIPKNLEKYVLDNRPVNYKTKIVLVELEDLLAYKNYYSKIESTINEMHKFTKYGRKPRHFSNNPEFKTPKYDVVIFSKIDFLKQCCEKNPFGSKYFMWIDAGTFRTKKMFFDHSLQWPNPHKMEILNDNKFLLINIDMNLSDKSPLEDKAKYLYKNKSHFHCYMFGGTEKSINDIHKDFWNEVDHCLSLGSISNEQILFQILFLQNPEKYYIWNADKSPLHSKNEIPYRLAMNTKFTQHYPINKNLKILYRISNSKWENEMTKMGYLLELYSVQKDIKSCEDNCLILTQKHPLFLISSSELQSKINRKQKPYYDSNTLTTAGRKEQILSKNPEFNPFDENTIFSIPKANFEQTFQVLELNENGSENFQWVGYIVWLIILIFILYFIIFYFHVFY